MVNMYMDDSVVDVHHVHHWTQGLNYNTWNPFLRSPELKNSNMISLPKCPHLLGVLVILLLLLHLLPTNSGLLVWLQQCDVRRVLSCHFKNSSAGGTPIGECDMDR